MRLLRVLPVQKNAEGEEGYAFSGKFYSSDKIYHFEDSDRVAVSLLHHGFARLANENETTEFNRAFNKEPALVQTIKQEPVADEVTIEKDEDGGDVVIIKEDRKVGRPRKENS